MRTYFIIYILAGKKQHAGQGQWGWLRWQWSKVWLHVPSKPLWVGLGFWPLSHLTQLAKLKLLCQWLKNSIRMNVRVSPLSLAFLAVPTAVLVNVAGDRGESLITSIWICLKCLWYASLSPCDRPESTTSLHSVSTHLNVQTRNSNWQRTLKIRLRMSGGVVSENGVWWMKWLNVLCIKLYNLHNIQFDTQHPSHSSKSQDHNIDDT